MVGFMLSFIVPKISAMFEQMHQDLPNITKFVISAGDFVTNYWLLIIIGMVSIILIFERGMKLSKDFKKSVDGFLLKVPIVGKMVESAELARFCYITSILIDSGVPFVKAVNLSANILSNALLSEIFIKASYKVVEGERLSVALSKSTIELDKAFVQAITLGEETSEVAIVLENLASLYIENNKDKISMFLSLLEPMLMLIVGGAIGFIVTSMLLPIFSMNIG
jgi:general secretion pathway protein F/type IV pilus assembly protein PilC